MRNGLPFARARGALAVVALAALAGCGGSSESTVDPTVGTAAEADASTPVMPTMTGAQLCQRLSIEAVASDLGLAVTDAVPDESATPQCAYEYTNDTGATSNLTVASMRPADVGGRTGPDAYEFTVEVNRAFARNAERAVDVGDDAIRLSGSSLHVGVLRLGDQVYTVIVPAADAEPTAVDTLLGTMASSLG